MPFRQGTFDGVILCRTLHHFENLYTAVRELRNLLMPEGFFAVVSEPVGSAFDAEALKWIARGVNEQVFSAAEYQHVMSTCGLRAVDSRIDWGSSLKMIAVPAGQG